LLEEVEPLPARRTRSGEDLFEAQAEFRLALRQFLHFNEATTRRAGLTPQQYQALLALYSRRRSGALRVGELAARLQVVHHSAVSLVDGLVARKLVVRARAMTDRRVVLLHVTTRGLRLIRRVSAENRIELRRLRPELLSFLRRLGA